ncbi:MAG: aspartate kinase [Candidatus Odinarchaeota archaeon]
MTILIMKFGGSCLVDKFAFDKILTITEKNLKVKKIYVASAFNEITNLLLTTSLKLDDQELVNKNLDEIRERHMKVIEEIFETENKYYIKSKHWIEKKLNELKNILADVKEFGLEDYHEDSILSFGEILSTYILNQFILSKGIKSKYLSGTDIIITNDTFKNAYPLYDLINKRIKERVIPPLNRFGLLCITGFIGRNKLGSITTLGRGGSDYTATIIARVLYDAVNEKDIKVIFWKDVDGLYAIDPQFIQNSSLINKLNYNEAKQIANFGAKILHPKCIEAIEQYRIPIEIRNFTKPLQQDHYTLISDETDVTNIKGISVVKIATIITITSGSMVDIPGVLAKIFKVMKKKNISVSFVAQSSSEVSTSFIVKKERAEEALEALKIDEYFSEFFKFSWEDVAIINITGNKVLENKTKAYIFTLLDNRNIEVRAISQSYKDLNLSIIIDTKNLYDAIEIIHKGLYEKHN